MAKIDHEYTHEIICPWCGYKYHDSNELDDSGENEECENCGKLFNYNRDVAVTYCTSRKKCEVCQPILACQPYIYSGKNWTIYTCVICEHETIKTGPIIDNKPYQIPIETKDG